LIAPDRVLTAAHCIDPATGNNFVLSVGVDAHDFSALPQSAFYGVKGVSIAPGFKLAFPFAHKRPQNATAVNDIAMIVLDRPVPGVTPVAIAGPGDAALEQPGDSGGPLLAQGPNGPVQIGVTSWGSEVKEKGCGEAHPLTLIKGATTKRFKRGTSKTRGKKLACAVTAANAGGSWTVYSPSVAG
jgi:secreted trypsin-like serine protease